MKSEERAQVQDWFLAGKQSPLFEGVLELTNISRPVVLNQPFKCALA